MPMVIQYAGKGTDAREICSDGAAAFAESELHGAVRIAQEHPAGANRVKRVKSLNRYNDRELADQESESLAYTAIREVSLSLLFSSER